MFHFAFPLLVFASVSLSEAPAPKSDDESRFVRRILECWKDKEYSLVRDQIEEFLATYPTSSYQEHFFILLGDIASYEKRYEDSLKWYGRITRDPSLIKSAIPKRWQVLYQQKKYHELREETEAWLKTVSESDSEHRFYYAEANFREGLSIYTDPSQKEEAFSLFKEALLYYKTVFLHPSFATQAKLSAAEIYRLLGNHPESAELYLELANTSLNENTREEVLFHAAISLSAFDSPKALKIFETLVLQGKNFGKEAAKQWFGLIVQTKEWDILSKNRLVFEEFLFGEMRALARFFLGKIEMETHHPLKAIAYFETSLDGGLPAAYVKSAVLNVLKCAQETNDKPAFERAYARLSSLFSSDSPEWTSIKIARALLWKKEGNTKEALSILSELKACEEAQLILAGILFEKGDFEPALRVCHTALDKNPTHPSFSKLTIEISLAQLKEKEDGKVYGQLVKDLELLFNRGLDLSSDEYTRYVLLLGRGYSFLGHDRDCQALLEKHLEQTKESTAAIHSLLAFSYWKTNSEPKRLILHGEETFRLEPQDPKYVSLRVALFNAYLQLAKEEPLSSYEQKAAEHLYAASQNIPISLEKKLWLAHYFARIACQFFGETEAKKAIQLLEPLVENIDDWFQFEEEVLLLSSLYGVFGDREKQSSYITRLSALQSNYPKAKWKCLEKTTLALANFYVNEKQWTNAKPLYENLEFSTQSLIASEAKLQLSRLLIQTLPEEERKLDSMRVQSILQRLNELKHRKILLEEPIHLEAAIEHAEFSSLLTPPEEKEKIMLKLLLEAKIEFSRQDDIWSKDYHASRLQHPDKDRVYQAYMRYMDAKMYLLQASLAKQKGDEVEAQTKESAARALFSTLRQGKFAASPYLIQRAALGNDWKLK